MIWLLCFAVLVPNVVSELEHSYQGNSNSDNNTWPDLNIRQRIKDTSYLIDRYPLYELPVNVDCKRPAKCITMNDTTCMGTRLPYSTTTLDIIPEPTTERLIREKLHELQALKHIPKCWAVVQPFLCSIFMPKCVNNTVDLPSQEMCRMISGPCRILFNHTIWPSFIKCEDTKMFPSLCKNDIREIKFNTTGKCLSPLVPTDYALAVFEGIEGCGYPCSDPLYTYDEKIQIHSLISWLIGICCFLNFFTVVTFSKSANEYPARVVFYINVCFMVSCFGWLAQFYPGYRDHIVCRKDGTLRVSEPSGESLSCVIVFVFVYYSIMAAMVWFVILTYTWHMSARALGKIQDRIDKKSAYFHLLAWCLPLMLTVTIMALGEIDGNYVTGICFVGYNNHIVRTWFVLVPVLIVMSVGGYFLCKGLITLICLRRNSQEIISERASAKIQDAILRTGLFSVFTVISVIITVYCHFYDFKHSSEWKQSFRDYIICSITSKYTATSDCKMKSKPNIVKLQLHLLAPLLAGIAMSSWVWTQSTLDTWMKCFKRSCSSEAEEPVKLKKHKVIAQAFAKRKMFNNADRLSLSFHNTHQGPVGLNFDLNSVGSQDFSSTWAAALPKLVTRRGALVGGSVSSNSRNSTDSQYSFSVRRVSLESRRNSCDSQFALSISEVKADFKTSRVSKTNGKRRRKPPERSRKRSDVNKRGRRDFEKSKPNKMIPQFRRSSTTSQESQLGVQILSALPLGPSANTVPLQVPNMKRRSGLTEEGTLTLKDAERLLPFLFTKHSDSEDDLSSENEQNELSDKNVDLESGTQEKGEIMLEMDELKQNIDEIINSRNYVPKHK
ncbi:hypothetical protein QAD02_015980 [Eretmocerus hayati]|uniref:Uncharacterized protein n=1 Tax=Eretmocerus hayati TaxID=131215 RepID=A0ACC2PAS5_9HYME|nr:hypothetical protein QAD02_015980 [Eretmocerus hayati]